MIGVVRRIALPLLLAALVVVPHVSAQRSFVIVRDVSIGGFPRAGDVRSAVAVFGEPSGFTDRIYDRCTLHWKALGLSMQTYYSQGALDPCGDSARHVSTTATDRRWRTSLGLRIGDPAAKLRRLYPKAQYQGKGEWWLTLRPFAGIELPGLAARVRNGRVASFTLHGPRVAF